MGKKNKRIRSVEGPRKPFWSFQGINSDAQMGRELGGTFVSPESGSRGDAGFAVPDEETTEEIDRLTRNDKLKKLNPRR